MTAFLQFDRFRVNSSPFATLLSSRLLPHIRQLLLAVLAHPALTALRHPARRIALPSAIPGSRLCSTAFVHPCTANAVRDLKIPRLPVPIRRHPAPLDVARAVLNEANPQDG